MGSKVSVVIPMYNSRDTIVPCVQSVIDQTYKDLITIIVVNDGSKDDSLAVLEAAFNNLPENRVLTIINKENGGVSSARNMGINAAKSDWVALLDSDDIWHPSKLERQFSTIAQNPDVQFIGCNVNNEVYPFFGKKKLPIFTLSPRQLIIKWYPSTPTILARRSLLIRAGLFDESKRRGEDCDLWLRCMMFTDLYILNESLVDIGHGKKPYGEKGLSADLKKMFMGEICNVTSALKRRQIGILFYFFGIFWLSLKFIRRIILVAFR